MLTSAKNRLRSSDKQKTKVITSEAKLPFLLPFLEQKMSPKWFRAPTVFCPPVQISTVFLNQKGLLGYQKYFLAKHFFQFVKCKNVFFDKNGPKKSLINFIAKTSYRKMVVVTPDCSDAKNETFFVETFFAPNLSFCIFLLSTKLNFLSNHG